MVFTHSNTLWCLDIVHWIVNNTFLCCLHSNMRNVLFNWQEYWVWLNVRLNWSLDEPGVFLKAHTTVLQAREGRSMSPNQSMRNGTRRHFSDAYSTSTHFKACIDASFNGKYTPKYDSTKINGGHYLGWSKRKSFFRMKCCPFTSHVSCLQYCILKSE